MNGATTLPSTERDVYYGQAAGWLKTQVVGRSALAGRSAGPLVVEEYDSTTVVPPGWGGVNGPAREHRVGEGGIAL